jgi:hypothetical protein
MGAALGDLRIHPRTFLISGMMAFAFIWLANRGLKAAGYPQFMA